MRERLEGTLGEHEWRRMRGKVEYWLSRARHPGGRNAWRQVARQCALAGKLKAWERIADAERRSRRAA